MARLPCAGYHDRNPLNLVRCQTKSLWWLSLSLMLLCGCGNHSTLWHDERLPSGKVIKVTSFNLVWGAEHDDRDSRQDCFALEYVSSQPQADPRMREGEAREVFELIRPTSELWGFRTSTLAGFPTTERKGHYDLFVFKHEADGTWSCRRYPSKVFVND